jgi:hypothetical protein
MATNIVRFAQGDQLELKKPHPCQSRIFTVLRVGSEVRVRCNGCGHDMVLDRIKLEKAIRRVHPAPSADSGNTTD